MLIEIHMIQNHSPSNLNRDDLGAPKTCIFGGVTRARISSQCLKRSIRRGIQFQPALEKEGGIRTRSLISELARRVQGDATPPDDLVGLIAKAFEAGGVKRNPTKGDPNSTNILLFLRRSGVEGLAEAIREERQKGRPNPEDLASKFAGILGEYAMAPDIALSGRMTELDSDGLFSKMDFTIEAALQCSHAISTHPVVNEVDYWTAADDLPSGQAAAHVNEAVYNSACFYKYFCLDWEQLLKNLRGPEPDRDGHPDAHNAWVQGEENAKKLAACTLGHFIRAAALTTPSGKQNSFAAHNLPDGILVEIKTESNTPTSYANAFADPVPLPPPQVDDRSRTLVAQSIAQLGQYVHDVAEGFGIKAERFWFSMNGRRGLRWIDNAAKEPEKEKPVIADIPDPENGGKLIPDAHHHPTTLDDLVSRVVSTATNDSLQWSEVCNAGRKEPGA